MIVFTGRRGGADDVTRRPDKAARRTVYVRCRPTAVGGPARAAHRRRPRAPSRRPLDDRPGAAKLAAQGSAPGVDAEDAAARRSSTARRPAALNYLVQGDVAGHASPSSLRARAGERHRGRRRLVAGRGQPGSVQRIRWNGMDATTHAGRHRAAATSSASTRRPRRRPRAPAPAAAAGRRALLPLPRPPVPDPRRATTSAAAPRAASAPAARATSTRARTCSPSAATPLVAARGGKVEVRGLPGQRRQLHRHRRRRHRRRLRLHAPGDARPVQERRGAHRRPDRLVGDTGDADGCHLHFEEWSAPGWYSGGRRRPAADLQAWDTFS